MEGGEGGGAADHCSKGIPRLERGLPLDFTVHPSLPPSISVNSVLVLILILSCTAL